MIYITQATYILKRYTAFLNLTAKFGRCSYCTILSIWQDQVKLFFFWQVMNFYIHVCVCLCEKQINKQVELETTWERNWDVFLEFIGQTWGCVVLLSKIWFKPKNHLPTLIQFVYTLSVRCMFVFIATESLFQCPKNQFTFA